MLKPLLKMALPWANQLPISFKSVKAGVFFGAGLSVLIFITACSPVVSPVQAPVNIPERFSTSGGSQLPNQWWQAFHDPALDTLIQKALSGNLTLLATFDRLRQAEAAARKAGADVYPDLDFQASISRTRTRTSGNASDANHFLSGIAAGYELDIWGRINALTQAAGMDVKASAHDLKTAAITLTAQMATAWYQLVETYGQIDLLNQQLDTNRKALDLVTLQFRTGQVSSADVLQQEQLIESRTGEKAKAEANARVFENQLAVLMGIPPDQYVAPRIARLIDLPSLPETGVPADLVKQRPDIRAAYSRVQAADQRVAAAIADRFPRLSLSTRVETSGAHVSDLFDDWLASLAANLAGPLLDGGLRKAEADRARAAAMEALHHYGQVILTAFAEVEDALAIENQQTVFISSLDRQAALAGQVVERVQSRYIKGIENYQRVLTALLSHQQLQRSRLTAQRDLVLNRIRLCRALGGGWEMKQKQMTNNDTLLQSKQEDRHVQY